MEICHKNCIGCEQYPKASDKKLCPTYNLRAKYIRHDIYESKRKKKLGDKYEYKPCKGLVLL